MKHTLTVIVLCILCLTNSFAQKPEKSKFNALSFELGKNGVICNLTFDHKFAGKNLGIRAGVGGSFGSYLKAYVAGGGGYYLAGKTKNFFELGVDIQYLSVVEFSDDQKGFPLVYPNYSVSTVYPSINLGFRTYGKKTLFRIGLSPGLVDGNAFPGAYISMGVRF